MPSPITLSGSIPVTNASGITISAATPDVTNSYTAGADFTFTNDGVLINTYFLPGDNPGGLDGESDSEIFLIAGNSTAGYPVNLITNTGIIIGETYNLGINVEAQSGPTNPVLITNSGTILNTSVDRFGYGIYAGRSVAATVTNSGKIIAEVGVQLLDSDNVTEIVTNLAGGTITATGGQDDGIFIASGHPGSVAGTGIIANYGDITGYTRDAARNATIINGGTLSRTVFAYGSGSLVVDPGAVFGGAVHFDNFISSYAPSTLLSTIVLAGTGAGTLAQPANYAGFGALTIAAGADWSLGNTTSTAGITGVTTITDLGTLNVGGDIAGVTLLAGPDAVIGFTGLNAGNSFSGAGTYAMNPVTGLAYGDSIILGPGVLNTADVLSQGENDTTSLGQAYEFTETGGHTVFVPYGGTTADPLTAQNLTFTTQGSEVTITIGEALPASPITLHGFIPATNPAGTTISSASAEVTNIYTAGAAFTFTNAGALINTNDIAMYLDLGGNSSGSPANLITNTGSVSGFSYGILVRASSAQNNPLLINNSGTILNTDIGYGFAIYVNNNVVGTVTNSGDITGGAGIFLIGNTIGAAVVVNEAGGTIANTSTKYNDAIVINQLGNPSYQGTGIVINAGLISGSVGDNAFNPTIINSGTITGPVYGGAPGTLGIDSGAVFGGFVDFIGQTSTILLGGTGFGTLANAASYIGFGALTVAAGADWTLGNTSISAGITGITTISDFGTLNLAGDIAGITLLAGPDAAIAFTGLNAGNSLSGFGPGVDATNPVTGLTVGDSIILGPGVLDPANVVEQVESDGTTLGQAYEFVETGGHALYVPYSGTEAEPLTAQNLTITTLGSEITIAVGDVVYTFTGGGTTTSFDDPSNYAGSLAPGNSIAAAEAVLVIAAATLSGVNTLTNDGTIIVAGASASFLDPTALTGTGTLVIENGGLVTLEDALDSATNFAFGADGTLAADGPLSAAATISNFTTSDSVIFYGLEYETGASVTTAGTIVTIHDGPETFSLNIVPSNESFHLSSVNGSLALTATPCFLAGTRIRTDQGEVAVEDLAIGDRVITLSGDAVPVKWLGRRSYRQPYPENSADIIPIRICRNALGPNLPKRDLYVSPLHAMYLADVLVPAGLLVNGRSIRACPEMPAVNYVHIELERHDVIFAEGAPSETFVDCDSRAMFENAAEFAALYPEDASPEWRFCAPRLESGPALRRIWSRLAGRAGLTASPGAPPHAKLLGYVDQAGHAGITGWAYLPAHPDEAVELEVLDGQGVIARILADRYRADLAQAGIGNGRHGFELTFAQPLPENRAHTIRVRRAGGAELARSPISLPARKAAAAPRAAGGKRALVLDALWPNPARDAGSNALLSHIAGLRELGFAVDLMAVQEPGTPPPRCLAGLGIGFPEFPGVEKLLLARGGDYAVIYMHRLAVAGPYGALVRSLSPALRIYSVADLHHRRLAGQARIEQDQALAVRAEQVRAEELLAMRQADGVITHTEAESAYLREACPGINVHTVPWAAPVVQSPLPFAARQGVVFVGNYRHAPNQDAVRWLLADIMPRVWSRKPGIPCRIAGAGWPATCLPVLDPRVTLTGFVPEWRDLFGQARLSVAPLRFGAGLKGKVLDSLAAGIPCAMTSLAAEGFGLEGADTAEDLAELICRLHEDAALNAAAGQAGQALVAARFGQEMMVGALRAVVGEKESGRFFEKKLRKKLLLQE